MSVYTTPFGNPLDFAQDRADIVFYYEQDVRLMAHWRQIIPPDRFPEIDDETLIADPEQVTRAMIGFAVLNGTKPAFTPTETNI